MKKAFLLFICSCAWAQVDRPQLGKILDSSGAVRTVYGISASVTVGAAEASGVLSSGCAAFCLVKTETSLNGLAAPLGPALFAFDGNTALVWFAKSRQLARWDDGALAFLDTSIAGEVLSISASQFIVRRPNGVWIVNQDGSVAGSLPTFVSAAMLISGGVVYAERGEIVVGGARFPLDRVTAIFQMSASYLQVRAGGLDYALRIDAGHEALFQLPGGAQ